MTAERLQKILAQAGVASRRASEELIRAGRVAVNGQVVTTMGHQVDPTTATITVDGQPLRSRARLVYLALNKPRGYVTTAGEDPYGRPTVMELVPPQQRLYPVGRLDAETEGLLLLTNDGELAHRLMHPRYYVQKEYIAKVRGTPNQRTLDRLRAGVPTQWQAEPVPPDRIDLIDRLEGDAALMRVVIHEGAKHQVRDMLDVVGHPVLSLRRTRVGPIFLGELRRGQTRELSPAEVASLRRVVRLPDDAPADASASPRPERPVPPVARHRPPPAVVRPPRPPQERPPAPSPAAERPAARGTTEPPPRLGGGGPRGSGGPRRGPWWASELDEHPPAVRTWHSAEARQQAPATPPPARPVQPDRPAPAEPARGATGGRPPAGRPPGRPGRPGGPGERPARPNRPGERPAWGSARPEGGAKPQRWGPGRPAVGAEPRREPPGRPPGPRPARPDGRPMARPAEPAGGERPWSAPPTDFRRPTDERRPAGADQPSAGPSRPRGTGPTGPGRQGEGRPPGPGRPSSGRPGGGRPGGPGRPGGGPPGGAGRPGSGPGSGGWPAGGPGRPSGGPPGGRGRPGDRPGGSWPRASGPGRPGGGPPRPTGGGRSAPRRPQ